MVIPGNGVKREGGGGNYLGQGGWEGVGGGGEVSWGWHDGEGVGGRVGRSGWPAYDEDHRKGRSRNHRMCSLAGIEISRGHLLDSTPEVAKLRNLVQKSKGSRTSAAGRFVAQGDDPECT